jgi:vacuolar-type H+-ATPase subunit I/STV1
MAIGVEVSVMSDEGNADVLEDGSYALEDGTALVVLDGRINQLGEDEPAVEEEVEVEVEMAEGDEADVQDWAGMEKRIQNLEDAVADLKGEDLKDDEVSEEMSVLSSEINGAFEHIMERLSAMENEPATDGVSHSPNKTKNQDMDQETFSSLKTADRAHAIISNFAKN